LIALAFFFSKGKKRNTSAITSQISLKVALLFPLQLALCSLFAAILCVVYRRCAVRTRRKLPLRCGASCGCGCYPQITAMFHALAVTCIIDEVNENNDGKERRC
jgi:hypothetical protein